MTLTMKSEILKVLLRKLSIQYVFVINLYILYLTDIFKNYFTTQHTILAHKRNVAIVPHPA